MSIDWFVINIHPNFILYYIYFILYYIIYIYIYIYIYIKTEMKKEMKGNSIPFYGAAAAMNISKK